VRLDPREDDEQAASTPDFHLWEPGAPGALSGVRMYPHMTEAAAVYVRIRAVPLRNVIEE
jgi:hypothetical protein